MERKKKRKKEVHVCIIFPQYCDILYVFMREKKKKRKNTRIGASGAISADKIKLP